MTPIIAQYPDYVVSRVPWALRLPGHWGVKRGKALFRRVVRPVRPKDEVLTCFRDGVVTLRKNRRTRGFTEAIKEHGYQGIRRGDLVIHAMDAFAGAAGVADSDGKGTPVYAVCVPRGLANAHYYAHIVREMARRQWILALARGIRERSTDFRFDAFATQVLPVPPPDEQAAIVRFLDYTDARIRRYIRAKQKLITLLEEQKQAVIHDVITRGLNSGAPMVETTQPWIPRVPAHWKLSPNRALLKYRKVLVGDRHREFKLLSLTKRGVIVRDLSDNKGKFSKDPGTAQEVRAGDLVFCLFDVPETPRTVGMSSHDGMITSAYTVFQCDDPHVARFLEVFYIAMDDRKLLAPLYSGLRNTIPRDRLLGIKTPLPPRGEMQAILDHIGRHAKASADQVELARRELELLRELRTRLIADVVTGQLDVRAAAAALPDTPPCDDAPVDDDEPLDADLPLDEGDPEDEAA